MAYYGGLQKCTGIGHEMQIMEADALKEGVLPAKELCSCVSDLYEKGWNPPCKILAIVDRSATQHPWGHSYQVARYNVR